LEESTDRAARIAAVLLGAQLSILVVAAVVVFRATLHDCEFYGDNPPMADGVPWCTPAAQIDLSPVLITILPTAAMLLAVAVGVWLARDWAVAGGIVWQVLLALILATLGVALWNEQSQNAWFDHFPDWTSPRQLAYALMVAVPVPTRVSRPLPNSVIQARAAVERNDPRCVNHLGDQRDIVLSLEHLHVLVVAARRKRRPRIEPD